MPWYRLHHDDVELEPSGCAWPNLAGWFVAGGLIAYGIVCLNLGRAWLIGRADMLRMEGSDATALAIAAIALGFALHVRFVWSTMRGLWRIATPVFIAALITFLVAFGYVIVHALGSVWG